MVDEPARESTTRAVTIGDALMEGQRRLERCGVLRPRRHAELLLETALKLDRTDLYLRARETLTPERYIEYQALLEQREAGEPVQYIAGWAPFYGRRFLVGEGVFIPRFDTELLVERLLERWTEDCLKDSSEEVLDLCCGCGVVGLTAAAELPSAHITLVDDSPTALEYCARNALMLLVNDRVEIIRRDARTDPPLEWHGRFSFITANPPYIPAAEVRSLHPDVRREPPGALTDGGDGLSFYRRWAVTLPVILKPGGRAFLEVGVGAAESVVDMLSSAFTEVETFRDLNGIERVVEAKIE